MVIVADELVILEHRHAEQCLHASLLDRGNHARTTLAVGLVNQEVGDVHHLLGPGDATKDRLGARPEQGLRLQRLDIGGGRAVHGTDAKQVSLSQDTLCRRSAA